MASEAGISMRKLAVTGRVGSDHAGGIPGRERERERERHVRGSPIQRAPSLDPSHEQQPRGVRVCSTARGELDFLEHREAHCDIIVANYKRNPKSTGVVSGVTALGLSPRTLPAPLNALACAS